MTHSDDAGASGGYDPVHFESLISVEDRHFWFKARNHVISILAGQVVAGLPPGYRLLEMGCGNGNVLRFLERACTAGKVVGMDLYQEGLRYARARTSCDLVRGDIRQSPFGETFPVIGVFDVLEHIPDDRGVLRDLFNMLDDSGVLLITVPAHRYLWSYFDEISGHCRRYRPEELRAKLEESGYAVEYLTQYMAPLHPFMWLSRKLRSGNTAAGSKEKFQNEIRVIPIVNGLFSWLLSIESKWIAKRRQLPFGASLVAVARKPLQAI